MRRLLLVLFALALAAAGYALWQGPSTPSHRQQHSAAPAPPNRAAPPPATAAPAPVAPPATAPQSFRRQPLPTRYLWQGAGVLVADDRAFGVDKAPMLAHDHFAWVAIKINGGTTALAANLDSLATWRTAYRQAGLRVCGWGDNQTSPAREARLVAQLVHRYQLDCYIADAEAPYFGTGYGGVVTRSATFTHAFRRLLPGLPAALTTYGAAVKPWIYPFDYGAWRQARFALLPQAYLSISPVYCLRCTVDNATRSGYPASLVHPMIGVGWSQGQPALSGRQYVRPLVANPTKGFSVFLGETTSAHDFATLGRAIQVDHIAIS